MLHNPKTDPLFHCWFFGGCLFRCDGAEGDENGRIDSTRVIKESPEDFLDIFFSRFIWFCFCKLLFGTIIGDRVLVGIALPYLGLLAFEIFEGVRNIIWYGKVNAVGVLIPIKGESEVALAFPVLCNFIIFFDKFNEMVSMLLTNILYPKIVHNELETDRPPFVCP